jgi:hypothetical protein
MILVERDFRPEVEEQDFKRFLRLPPLREFPGPVAENAAWARSWYAAHGRPWMCAAFLPASAEPGAGVMIAGRPFGGTELGRRFVGITGAAVVAASAGPEAEAEAAARWAASEPDLYYFLECFASAVVEALLAESRRRLVGWGQARGLEISAHYCPGYPDWTVGDAPRLLELLAAGRELPGPLDTLSSGMLRPKKSQLAAVGFAAAGAAPR